MFKSGRPAPSCLVDIMQTLSRGQQALGIDVGTHSTKAVWVSRNWMGRSNWCSLRLHHTFDPTSANGRNELARRLNRALDCGGVRPADRISACLSMAWCSLHSLAPMDVATSSTNGTAINSAAGSGANSTNLASTFKNSSLQDRFHDRVNDGQKYCIAPIQRDRPRGRATNSANATTTENNSAFDMQQILAIPEHMTTEIAEALDAQHMSLERLDGVPWCLARALSFVADQHVPELLIDWGYSAITVVACHENRIVHCRKLACPGLVHLYERIEGELDFSRNCVLELVEDLPRVQADLNTETLDTCIGQWSRFSRHEYEFAAALIAEHVTEVIEELNVSIRFIHWKHPANRLKQVWICGGGGMLPALIGQASQMLGISISPWRWTPPVVNDRSRWSSSRLVDEPLEFTADMAVAASLIPWPSSAERLSLSFWR